MKLPTRMSVPCLTSFLSSLSVTEESASFLFSDPPSDEGGGLFLETGGVKIKVPPVGDKVVEVLGQSQSIIKVGRTYSIQGWEEVEKGKQEPDTDPDTTPTAGSTLKFVVSHPCPLFFFPYSLEVEAGGNTIRADVVEEGEAKRRHEEAEKEGRPSLLATREGTSLVHYSFLLPSSFRGEIRVLLSAVASEPSTSEKKVGLCFSSLPGDQYVEGGAPGGLGKDLSAKRARLDGEGGMRLTLKRGEAGSPSLVSKEGFLLSSSDEEKGEEVWYAPSFSSLLTLSFPSLPLPSNILGKEGQGVLSFPLPSARRVIVLYCIDLSSSMYDGNARAAAFLSVKKATKKQGFPAWVAGWASKVHFVEMVRDDSELDSLFEKHRNSDGGTQIHESLSHIAKKVAKSELPPKCALLITDDEVLTTGDEKEWEVLGKVAWHCVTVGENNRSENVSKIANREGARGGITFHQCGYGKEEEASEYISDWIQRMVGAKMPVGVSVDGRETNMWSLFTQEPGVVVFTEKEAERVEIFYSDGSSETKETKDLPLFEEKGDEGGVRKAVSISNILSEKDAKKKAEVAVKEGIVVEGVTAFYTDKVVLRSESSGGGGVVYRSIGQAGDGGNATYSSRGQGGDGGVVYRGLSSLSCQVVVKTKEEVAKEIVKAMEEGDFLSATQTFRIGDEEPMQTLLRIISEVEGKEEKEKILYSAFLLLSSRLGSLLSSPLPPLYKEKASRLGSLLSTLKD